MIQVIKRSGILLLVLFHYSCAYAQKAPHCDTVLTWDTCYNILLISMAPFYTSNIVEFSENSNEENTFLFKPRKPWSIDSLLSRLTQGSYASKANVIDSLSYYFVVYRATITLDQTMKSPDPLKDRNNYQKAYMFMFKGEAKKGNSIAGYLASRYTMQTKIVYCTVPNPSDVNAPIANALVRAIF